MEELYKKICAGEELRASLIAVKGQLKEEKNREQFRDICGGNYDAIMKCLVDEDAKVRRNSAEILGILKVQEAVDVLMDAYLEEETRFVRPYYVKAMAELDCEEYMGRFRERLEELEAYDAPVDERKHVQGEIAALRRLMLDKEGIKSHTFTGYGRTNEVILTTQPAFREILAADLPFKKTIRGDGVAVLVGDMNIVLACRYWQEMLFVLHVCGESAEASERTDDKEPALKAAASEIATALRGSDLTEILDGNHRGTPPYYFRVGITGPLNREARAALAKSAGAGIEKAFGGALINSASHYEIEIRLAADRDGRITPYLKLFTIPDDRFRYRRYHVAAGMKPFVAAGLIGLAKPYLKEHAQVLDPFCGVGTLLIERRYAGPVRSAYGIDTFGEAVDKARKNAQIAGMPVNYINRNFFDFTHDYVFDEIITDMPEWNSGIAGTEERAAGPADGAEEESAGGAGGGKSSHAEIDEFYHDFLVKSVELLTPQGRIFCYTGEVNLMRKHIRLSGRFRLLREIPIMERAGTSLFILEMKDYHDRH